MVHTHLRMRTVNVVEDSKTAHRQLSYIEFDTFAPIDLSISATVVLRHSYRRSVLFLVARLTVLESFLLTPSQIYFTERQVKDWRYS